MRAATQPPLAEEFLAKCVRVKTPWLGPTSAYLGKLLKVQADEIEAAATRLGIPMAQIKHAVGTRLAISQHSPALRDLKRFGLFR